MTPGAWREDAIGRSHAKGPTLTTGVAIVVAALVLGCGNGNVGTAADGLAGYFDAAQAVDRDLAEAAALANQSVRGASSGPILKQAPDKALVRAVEAADPQRAAKRIPPGLPPDLLQAVLVVQRELVSRQAALGGIYDGRVECLRNGAPAATRFHADLAAARELATTSPPFEVAAPDSPAAAELAVRLVEMNLANRGCGECGGSISSRNSQLPRVRWGAGAPWGAGPKGPTTNEYGAPIYDGGRIEYPDRGFIEFDVDHEPGRGWQVQLNAC